MKLEKVTGTPFYAKCAGCSQNKLFGDANPDGDGGYADVEGKAFEAYYCQDCGDLDRMARIENALDAMDDTSCLTRADYVEGVSSCASKVSKPAVQHLYSAAWDAARLLVRTYGMAEAAKIVAKRIEELGR